MKITRQPWAATSSFQEPKHPGPGATLGELFEYGLALKEIQHLRPGFLKEGTRVLLRDGRKATVTNFVPFDGYNIGLRVDGAPHEGLITTYKDIKVIS